MSRQAANGNETQDAGADPAIVSVEKGASSVRVTAGGSSFLCSVQALADVGLEVPALAVGRLLAEPEGESSLGALLALAAEATEARKRALALLARAEQSRFLLGAKLAQRGFGTQAANLALDRLEAEGLLSDRRYAEAWLSGHGGKAGAGPRKLAAGLRARGLGEETVASAMRAVFGEEERAELLDKAASRELSRLEREEGLSASKRRSELRSRLRAEGFRSEEIAAWFDRRDE